MKLLLVAGIVFVLVDYVSVEDMPDFKNMSEEELFNWHASMDSERTIG